MSLVNDTRSALGDLAGVLELVMDRAAIDKVVSRLDEAITDLESRANALGAVGGTSFGSSALGALAHAHTSKAYDAVQESLVLMKIGMQDYIEALHTLASDSDEADGASADVHKKLLAGLREFDSGSRLPNGGRPIDGHR